MHPNHTTQEIPYGYCHCGCGQPTEMVKNTDTKHGRIKGQPNRYLPHHHRRTTILDPGPNPSGLCMCGCGEKTPIATWSRKRDGHLKGRPIRYIHNHGKRKELEDAFWAKVDRRGPDECWEWIASRNPRNYGTLRVKNRTLAAHRVSYEIHHGSVPDGLWVLHKCDNPPCCNPDHLFLGTPQDNVDDMIAKGRQARGEKKPAWNKKR